MRFVSPLVAVLLVVAAMLAQQNTAYAVEPSLSGTVTDITTGQPVANVCVTVGPPVRCATNTKADGTYFLDMTQTTPTWNTVTAQFPSALVADRRLTPAG